MSAINGCGVAEPNRKPRHQRRCLSSLKRVYIRTISNGRRDTVRYGRLYIFLPKAEKCGRSQFSFETAVVVVVVVVGRAFPFDYVILFSFFFYLERSALGNRTSQWQLRFSFSPLSLHFTSLHFSVDRHVRWTQNFLCVISPPRRQNGKGDTCCCSAAAAFAYQSVPRVGCRSTSSVDVCVVNQCDNNNHHRRHKWPPPKDRVC